ncbi:hypothetical protein SAPIO_CDS3392 [Scedosporium apiospermum]|uniref:Uncharacterized protein n=1 Tax=Pseudallescheria apiosperma TaxID=563466 RepID=A0A084GAP0_PSEDA|nr:uncharacterized protein SAPIO_CDS3392 [Scedosporium apiospermum]KEZ44402.1 hypothetical protein SAPIO_CDS3392 [Scedosporium apiospermum]
MVTEPVTPSSASTSEMATGVGRASPSGSQTTNSREQHAQMLFRIQQLEEQVGRAGAEHTMMASRIQHLEEQLSNAETEHSKTKTLLEGAISEQPELVQMDKLSQNRRKMSRFAARPVVHSHALGTGCRLLAIWRHLINDIEYLSEFCFPEQISWETLTPAVQEKLIRWAPKAKQYLESGPQRSRLIFEAWIWHILDDNIFSTVEGPWLGEHWEAYSMLRRIGAPLASESDAEWTLRYHIWRNLTVGLIRETTQHEARLDYRVVMNVMMEELGPFFHIPEPLGEAKLNERLFRIVKWAIEADFCMHLDRTEWSVVFGHPETQALHSFLFRDPQEVRHPPDPIFGSLKPVVSKSFMALSDVAHWWDEKLFSHGDQHGYAYHIMYYRDPMQVVVDMFPDDDEYEGVSGDDSDGDGDAESDGKQERTLKLDTEMAGPVEVNG